MSTMKGGLGNLLKQAQQMQAKMQEAQEQLANMVVTGEAGAGMVKIEMNGRHDVKRTHIDASAAPGMSEEDREMLADLVTAAVNDAVRKVETASRDKLSNLTSGLQMPPGFGDLMGGNE